MMCKKRDKSQRKEFVILMILRSTVLAFGPDKRGSPLRTRFDGTFERFWVTVKWVCSFLQYSIKERSANLIPPSVFSWTGSMTTPLSMNLDMSNTAKDITHDMNMDASARCNPVLRSANEDQGLSGTMVPGQILNDK